MSVTIKDVALRAGVSPITVSRAFSGTHPVATKTQRKIFAVAEELGYVPHLMARALASRHNPMIGAVVTTLSNPFFSPVIDAIQEVMRQSGYLTTINQSKFDPELEIAGLEQFRQMRTAGIITVSVLPELDHLDQLRETGVSVVLLARRWPTGDYVATDHFAGGYLAGEHLCRLGHRKIACVAPKQAIYSAASEKIEGFQAALREYDVSFSPDWIIWTHQTSVKEGVQAADVLIEHPGQPTAVFITADHQAVGVLHRLRERGVSVPSDMAVVGHDDIRYAEFMEVPLTTVALPKYEIGQRAARILLERIENKDTPPDMLQQVLLKPKLIVRASCGSDRHTENTNLLELIDDE